MKRGLSLLLIAALPYGVGACAKALTSTGSATSPSPASDVFSCVRQQIKAVGFSQESYDEQELRVTAHKYNESVRRPDVRFRRLVDRVTFDVNPAGSEGTTATSVTAQASTFVELSTHRGPTEQQERTSETAKDAARTVLGHCATAAAQP
jgi:hypothetical protein